MADERDPEEGGSALFDRWLSHRQESTGVAARPRTYGVPRTGLAGGEDATDPAASKDQARPGGQEHREDEPAGTPAAEREPEPEAPATREAAASGDGREPGRSAEPPTTSAPATQAPATEDPARTDAVPPAAPTRAPDPQATGRRAPLGLDEFEPVVIASVRRQAETPVEKRSRLARFRRAGLEHDPADAPTEDPTDDVPAERPGAGAAVEHLEIDRTTAGAADDEAVDDEAADDGAALRYEASDPAAAEHPTAEHQASQPGASEATRATEPTGTLPPAQPPTPYIARHPTPPPPVAGQPPAAEPVVPPSVSSSSAPAPAAGTPSGQQDAAAAVFAAFNPGGAPAPSAPSGAGGTAPTPAPEAPTPPTAQTTTRTSQPTADDPGPAKGTRRPRRPRPSLASYVEAARTTLDRSIRGTPEERASASRTDPATPATDGPSAADPLVPDRTSTPAPGAETTPGRSAYDELRAQREAAAPPQPDVLPPSIDFRPRTLARRLTSALLLVGLVATGVAAWRAYDSRVETDIGLAAILALASGVVWAVRAGSVPTRVGLHGGVLEVRSQAGRFVFEVTGPHTRLEVVGSPGRRGSRLLVHRRGLGPFAITPAMVDLRQLVEALRYYHPDL